MHGNFEMCFFASFGLPLIDDQYVIVDVLQAHPTLEGAHASGARIGYAAIKQGATNTPARPIRVSSEVSDMS